jgi:NNP family nitrate/nitrite transporter-like MFS transporter
MTIAVEHEFPAAKSRAGWIDQWEPEDADFWAATGNKVARRNLAWSIFAEHLGFVVWSLWSIVVLSLPAAGLKISVSEQFWLVSLPNLVGSALRIPYTFAVPRFGGRLWTTISASLLLIPTTLLAVIVPSQWLAHATHGTQFWILLGCAATAGVGGGNFSSSMANISFFYPERKKGFALGLNAAGGNLGVALVQIVVPLAVIIGVPKVLVGKQVHLAYAGLIWMPFIVLGAIGAWTYMNSLTQAKSDTKSYGTALKHAQTWTMSILYIGTFGSFIGFSFALPLVIKNTFPEFLATHTFIRDYLAGLGFVGALIGSVSRPFGGWLSDRLGGSRVTLGVFIGMALFAGLAAVGVADRSFTLFFAAFMVIFALSGIGNGSTYRMIPAIFATLGRREGLPESELVFKRKAAAVIGIAGAIGAFGGFLVQQVFRLASTPVTAAIKGLKGEALQKAAAAHASWPIPAMVTFIIAYLVFAALTWLAYVRKTSGFSGV